MEFGLGMFVGIAVGVIATLFINATPQTNADKHVELLNTQAKKSLQKLQQSSKQISQVSVKAETVRRDLKLQITELADQE